jgi:beta-xylosidase
MNAELKFPLKKNGCHIAARAKRFALSLAAVSLLGFPGKTDLHSVNKNNFSSFTGIGPKSQKELQFKSEASLTEDYKFNGKISRKVLENYLSRSITMESFLTGKGDFDDNLRMIRSIGAKFIGRSVCQWGGEANLLSNFEKEKELEKKVHQLDQDIILQACIFEIVSNQVEQVPVPGWAFTSLGMPVEKRNFHYTDIIYPEGQRRDWDTNSSVPDVSRSETKLWFYFLAASYIDMGIEAIHFGQVEIMNKNDPENKNWEQLLSLVRAYASVHGRRHFLICDGHVPSGGLMCDGRLLLDFHSFPMRIKEVPGKPEEAILEVGHTDAIYNRSKGGMTYSGWKCEHLPYLVEFDNYGISSQPGKEKAGEIPFWVWGYDEISWFAKQTKEYRTYWLHYAWDWVKKTDSNGFLEMPGSRTETLSHDKRDWYYANKVSKAVPDGLGDEETIRDIWTASLPTPVQEEKAIGIYHNPVIPGDFPDPTVIRVGNMYYAAGTSNDFGPCYPLYESTDLINWKPIGSVFNDCPKWSYNSFWAPELYYNNGTFYVYYTAKRKSDHVSCIGVATTKDIHKGFTDKGIIVEWGKEAIDAFVFKDGDGKLYITWKAYGLNKERPSEILASELSSDGLSMTGEHFSLTRYDKGWQGKGDEGECLVKHGEYYYMLYSIGGCCDENCSYRVMISRSRSLRGNWEQYPEPLLQGGKQWRCPGHGTLVETSDHRYFYLYHAYQAKDFQFIGRQGMLDELIWDEASGWPRFKNGNTPSDAYQISLNNAVQFRDSAYTDDFSSDENLKIWQWDLNKQKPEIKINNRTLTLSSTQKGIVFAGLSPKTGDYSFQAKVYGTTSDPGGICVYGDQKNLLALTISQARLVLFKIDNGEKEILSETSLQWNKPVYLKIEAVHGSSFRFFWSSDGANWISVKTPNEYYEGAFLPRWGEAMRTGLVFDNQNNGTAEFSYVRLYNKFNF